MNDEYGDCVFFGNNKIKKLVPVVLHNHFTSAADSLPGLVFLLQK